MWVLANHIQYHNNDGRFSSANKAWAQDIYIPRPQDRDTQKTDHNTSFLLNSHATLVDYIAGEVQKLYNELGLLDQRHKIDGSTFKDYEGELLILKAEMLNEANRTPENQYFYATHGNGCNPNAIGRSVFGEFLSDGEKAVFDRSAFLGIADESQLPEWVDEKLTDLQTADAPDEGQGMTMS
jgi:hypothetical protein